MKYLFLTYLDEKNREALSSLEQQREMAKCQPHVERLAASGKLLDGAPLHFNDEGDHDPGSRAASSSLQMVPLPKHVSRSAATHWWRPRAGRRPSKSRQEGMASIGIRPIVDLSAR
jgi:hypothetical protein